MTKKSKIDKWDLKNEVLYLHKNGKSNEAIAETISDKYSDIPELEEISAMSVNRFLNSCNEKELEMKIEEVKDPAKVMEQEFNLKMRSSIQDAEEARITIDHYMSQLRHDKLGVDELAKIISSWQKINDQYRKNLVSLREFTENKIVRPTQNIIYKKEINIKNLLVGISRDLCPECRKRVSERVKELKEEKIYD
jgi:hypothetical protein